MHTRIFKRELKETGSFIEEIKLEISSELFISIYKKLISIYKKLI